MCRPGLCGACVHGLRAKTGIGLSSVRLVPATHGYRLPTAGNAPHILLMNGHRNSELNPQDCLNEALIQVRRSFDSLPYDVRAEVFVLEVSRGGIAADRFYFQTQSTFRRSKARDIQSVRVDTRESGDGQVVVDTNREGLYDMLPEGLFHLGRPSDAGGAGRDVFQDIREARREEADARKFFGPFENEFYQRRLQLEQREYELLLKGDEGRAREVFHRLHGSSEGLEGRYILPLLHMLPLFHRIRGDMYQVARCLARFLGRPVRIGEAQRDRRLSVARGLKPLGEALLGVDAVAGDCFSSGMPAYEVHVSDIPRDEIRRYFPGGGSDGLIGYLLPRLLPMECGWTVVLHLQPGDRGMQLADETEGAYLGYDTYL